jgi:hypothetical protein
VLQNRATMPPLCAPADFEPIDQYIAASTTRKAQKWIVGVAGGSFIYTGAAVGCAATGKALLMVGGVYSPRT